ncbi:hypothetical protein DIS09_25950 [Burkholderia pseudomallei]|nr:hypothetical protein DIS09_25950 [Burkholderia pseudomallei]
MPSSAIDKPGRAIDPRALPNRHGRQPASRLPHRPPAAPGASRAAPPWRRAKHRWRARARPTGCISTARAS